MHGLSQRSVSETRIGLYSFHHIKAFFFFFFWKLGLQIFFLKKNLGWRSKKKTKDYQFFESEAKKKEKKKDQVTKRKSQFFFY